MTTPADVRKQSDVPTLDFDPFAGPTILSTAPSTEPQREIWTAAQIGDDASLSYNESVTLWMRGPLDVSALKTSLADVVLRHEALRATFSGDGLTIMFGAAADVEVELADWSSFDDAKVASEWDALVERDVTTPFDLQRGPVARATCVRVREGEHRVVFTAHHIVCDGWSTAVIIRDWAAIYSARARGSKAELAPAQAFSAYARELLSQERATKSLEDEAYWVGRFDGEIPILELPTDRPRPPRKTYRAFREDVVLDQDLVRDLKRVGAKEKASLFATLLAGFKALLFRLSGQEDLIVGIPAAGQSVGGHDELVGHCVNMLPLRDRVDAGKPFRALLAEVRKTVLDAYDHQLFTFGQLLKKLPIARDPSRLPLVSVVFNLDRGLGPDQIGFDGVRTELTTNIRRYENFDIFLNAVELDGKLVLECEYNTDLFDAATIRRWMGAYERVLRAVVSNPGCDVGLLPVMSEEERAQIARWNDAAALDIPRGACVHHLIEEQAARTPNALAVDFEVTTVTYRDLDQRANALAHKLRDVGVARGALVGLCVERSIEMIVGLLGILKSGAAYVPLDPGYPLDRLSFMAEDSKMRVLVTGETLRADLPLPAEHIVTIESITAGAESLPKSESSAGPEDCAYVIYTSGSTGKPKGVLVPHRAVVNLLSSVQRTPGLKATDIVLAVTTLSFDIAVSEILLPLTVGAKIVLASREVASDGARLLELLHTSKATFLDATPATWRLLLAAGWNGGEGLKAICTGEAMPRDLAVELVKRCATVWNGYGPTETTVWSTFYELKAPVGRILIGHPVANTDLYVLDARMRPVPIGVVGELFVGGAGVTYGYHDRPELTRERFVPDPFRGGAARMYKTGDLVRLMPDGNLECLGRNDNQVKLRGFRIELGEVENALGQHDSVKQTAVIVREDRPGDTRLVGYVVFDAGKSATDAELRAHLKKTLPDYMVPQNLARLDTMPLTPSGKIDRKRLPQPEAGVTPAESFVAPRTDTEKMLAGLWQEILAIGRVGVEDDFFALGGHSLLASQVLARLRRDHGVELSFRKMFEAPTVAELARVVEAARETAPAPREAPIPRRSASGPAPLSISQRRLWLLEEMDPKQRNVHNLPAAWRLEGKLDAGVLQRAVDEIVRRHETLRTNIRLEQGELVQVISKDRRIEIEHVDLRDVPASEHETLLRSRSDAWTQVPFDLGTDPLLRLWLLRLEDDVHVLYTLRHNIIWDGWSFDLFLRELSVLYGPFARSEPSPLAPLPITYADYATWQREWLSSPEVDKQVAFWRGQLDDDPLPLELPTDRPRGGTRTHSGANQGINVDRRTVDGLTSLAREHGATLFMAVFAAFNVLLHRYTGQTDIMVGTPMRARTRPEMEDIIGPFVNSVVLRIKLDPEMTYKDLLVRVRDVTLDAFTNQALPLEVIGGRPPLVRAFFSLQDARNRPLSLGDVKVTQWHAQPPAAANEMMLWTMEKRDNMLAMLNYSTDLFDSDTARRFLRQLEKVLVEALRDPGHKVGSIPIVPAEERRQIESASELQRPVPADHVVSLIRSKKDAEPQSTALSCEGRDMTYDELLRRVDSVARALSSRGVGAGVRVAVRLAGSDLRVVGALGVLASGAILALSGENADAALDGASDEAIARGEATRPVNAEPVVVVPPEAPAFVARREVVSHAVLANALASMADSIGLTRQDVAIGSASLDSVAALYGVLLPLSAGASVVLTSPDGAKDAARLGETLASASATVYLGPPSTWRALLSAGGITSDFKAIVFGPTNHALASGLSGRTSSAWTAFAPWALGSVLTLHRLSADEPAFARVVGRPIANTKIRVVDARGEPTPFGVPGALVVTDASRRERRTGDRVRLLGSGELEYVGRFDRHVELSGTIVDLDAVATTLEKHAAVESAFASVRDDRMGEPRVVVYFVARDGQSFTETELRNHVRTALGSEVVPQAFVELDGLPKDRTGTVDDARLPSPYATSAAEEYVAPRTDTERYLASVWSEALVVEHVGAYDNFFSLGGHSLLCFQVIARLEEKTGKRLSPRSMLLNSLAQIAEELDGPPTGQASAATTPRGEQVEPAPAKGLLEKLKRLVNR